MESEAAKAIDAVFATPLPEAVTRSLIERRVIERVVAETLASGHMQTMVAGAANDERTELLVKQILDSPAMQHLLADALDSQLTVELADRLVQNPQLQRVVEDAVREGLARRTATLVDTMASGAHHLDRRLERAPRRWLGRPPRPPALPDREPAVPFAGIGSRAAAFLVDSAIVHFGYLIGCGMFALVAYLVGWTPSRLLADGLAGVGWMIVVATYFVSFWTAAGQTPGMRMLRLKLTQANGHPVSAGRSFIRLLGSLVAVAMIFIGFVPVLVDDRRRALQDFIAATVVIYEPATSPQPVHHAAPERAAPAPGHTSLG